MTDLDLLRKKLAFIETCLRELRTLGQPERIATDVKERRFVEHTLQICIQAVLDIASHIVSDQRLRESETHTALFSSLANAGWIDLETAQLLRAAVGFRNVLVDGYTNADPAVVEGVLTEHLGDLDRTYRAVLKWPVDDFRTY